MMRFPFSVLAVALATAVSVPAQVFVQASLGRHNHGSVRIGERAPRHVEPRGAHPVDRHAHRPPVRQRGHWQTIEERVLVPGYWHDEHVPPTYGWIRNHCGHRHWGIVDPGGCRRVWVPARWETRCRRVWVGC